MTKCTFKFTRKRCKTCPLIHDVVKMSETKRSMKITYYFACISANVIYCMKQDDDQVTASENTFTTQKEMTRTYPNQSLDTIISLVILRSVWQFSAFPFSLAVRKAAKLQNENLSFKQALLIPTVSTIAFHSTDILVFSRYDVPTDSIVPFFCIQTHTHNPLKGSRLKRQL